MEKEGVFQLNNKTNKFEKDKLLSQILVEGGYISGKVSVDKSNRIWIFTKSAIYYITSEILDSNYKINKLSIPFTITNPMNGFENISQIGYNEYLVGKTDGYFIINLSNFKVKTHNLILNSVLVNRLEKSSKYIPISEEVALHNSENNIVLIILYHNMMIL